MALQGKYNFFGRINADAAYAIVDQINISKGGDAFCHVSVYASAPVPIPPDDSAQAVAAQGALIPDAPADAPPPQVDRGPVIEHFTISGISVKGLAENPFSVMYAGIKTDERLAQMLDV